MISKFHILIRLQTFYYSTREMITKHSFLVCLENPKITMDQKLYNGASKNHGGRALDS